MITKYLCPVCGFDELPYPASDHNICVCCGTEYGYHDSTLSHADLRDSWVASGAKWHSRRVSPPKGWTAYRQLVIAGYVDAAELVKRGEVAAV